MFSSNCFCNIFTSKNTTKIWICEIDIGCSLCIGIRKTRNTDDFLGSGTKLFITFLSLRFFDMRRERHNFFLCWLFHLTPPCAPPRRKLLVWPRRAPKINFLPLASNPNSRLFFKSQNPQPIASGHDVIHIPSPISYLGFFIVTSVIVTSSPRAREHLHSMCVPN